MIGPLPRHGKRRLQRRGRRYVSLIDAPQRGAPFASLTCSVGSAKLAPAARAYPVSGSPVSPAMRARLGRPGYGAVGLITWRAAALRGGAQIAHARPRKRINPLAGPRA